jgi:hypothetical protein
LIDYLIRVRRYGDEYRATLRRVAPSSHPDELPITGPEITATGQTAPAAMLAAITEAHLPEIPAEPRASRYAC